MASSLFIRLTAMLARFTLMILLVKELGHQDVTTFSATNASVLLLAYIIGMDLYISASRNIDTDRVKFFRIISNQILFSGIVGLVIILAALNSSGRSQLILAALLVSEVMSQELYRIHLYHGAYRLANLIQFMKTGIWALIATLLLLIGRISDVSQILQLWLAGSLCASIMGSYRITKYFYGYKFSPSWKTFKGDLFANLLIFWSSISLLIFNTVDRLLLSQNSDNRAAAYVFYGAIAGSVSTLIYTSVVNPLYSRIVRARGNRVVISRLMRQMERWVYVLVGGGVLAALVAIFPLAMMMRQPYLLENIDLLFILMLNAAVLGVALVPHYQLLAFDRDREIALAALAGVIVHLVTVLPAYHRLGALGVGISVTLGTSAMWLAKCIYARRSAAI